MAEVFVYCADVTDVSEAHFVECLAVLSADERQRFHGMKSVAKQKQFVVGRSLLRYVLSFHTGIDPAQLSFGVNSFGKPFLFEGVFHFNISHKDDRVVCVVSESVDVGVDVESVAVRRDFLSIAKRSFCPGEFEALFKVSRSKVALRHLFYRFWCLKEAYLKAAGLGLHESLSRCCFDIKGSEVVCSFADEPEVVPHFSLFQFSDDFLCAISVVSFDDSEFDFQFFKALPLVSRDLVDAPLLLASSDFSAER